MRRLRKACLKWHVVCGHDELRHHFFDARFFKGDFQLVTLDRLDPAIAEFLVKHPIPQSKGAYGGGVNHGMAGFTGLAIGAGAGTRLQPLPARRVIDIGIGYALFDPAGRRPIAPPIKARRRQNFHMWFGQFIDKAAGQLALPLPKNPAVACKGNGA